jgi:hypothetical protein
VLPQPGDANTAKAQPQGQPQEPPAPSPSAPTKEELQRENSTHAYAATVANDGYPRYISGPYVPRGYVAIFDDNLAASEKIQEDTNKEQANCSNKEQANCSKTFGEPPSEESDCGQEQANCSNEEQANCSNKEQANCSKNFGEPPSEESDCGQEQANCSNKEQANCSNKHKHNTTGTDERACRPRWFLLHCSPDLQRRSPGSPHVYDAVLSA